MESFTLLWCLALPASRVDQSANSIHSSWGFPAREYMRRLCPNRDSAVICRVTLSLSSPPFPSIQGSTRFPFSLLPFFPSPLQIPISISTSHTLPRARSPRPSLLHTDPHDHGNLQRLGFANRTAQTCPPDSRDDRIASLLCAPRTYKNVFLPELGICSSGT